MERLQPTTRSLVFMQARRPISSNSLTLGLVVRDCRRKFGRHPVQRAIPPALSTRLGGSVWHFPSGFQPPLTCFVVMSRSTCQARWSGQCSCLDSSARTSPPGSRWKMVANMKLRFFEADPVLPRSSAAKCLSKDAEGVSSKITCGPCERSVPLPALNAVSTLCIYGTSGDESLLLSSGSNIA